jgi:hypothetical protein
MACWYVLVLIQSQFRFVEVADSGIWFATVAYIVIWPIVDRS